VNGPLPLVRGTLDILVLKALSWEPAHGYAVATWIRERSGDAFLVEEGALYPALHRLERRGAIASEWGLSDNNRKAKYYRLTARGRAQLRAEATHWERYVGAVGRILRAAER
jgi:transcriptional regulator